MKHYHDMTSKYLCEVYVPDIYQKSIFTVDYERLWDSGMRLLSFDVDDTIVPLEQQSVDKMTVALFERLKMMGFTICLISNNHSEHRIKSISKRLGVPAISAAGKPRTDSLQQILDAYYHLHGETIIPRQMMHTGNSILSDVASGNLFGATTCLVRNIGKLGRVLRIVRPKERELCHELERRGLWRKHHVRAKGDQYYQLGKVHKM
jgi:HAD superfamily phosphatase (TIGR01668 family)